MRRQSLKLALAPSTFRPTIPRRERRCSSTELRRRRRRDTPTESPRRVTDHAPPVDTDHKGDSSMGGGREREREKRRLNLLPSSFDHACSPLIHPSTHLRSSRQLPPVEDSNLSSFCVLLSIIDHSLGWSRCLSSRPLCFPIRPLSRTGFWIKRLGSTLEGRTSISRPPVSTVPIHARFHGSASIFRACKLLRLGRASR